MSSTPPALASVPALVDANDFRNLADFRLRLRMFLSFSEQASEAAGVTAQQYQLLQIISLDDREGLSITHIAQRMLLRHNSAVELVDRADRAGLVRRIPDSEDLRRALVIPTLQGRSVLARLVAEHLQYLQQQGPTMLQALERVVAGSS